LAQGSLLAFGVSLFNLADSQTSIACFILGGGLILATGMRSIRNQPARVHLLCLLIFITGGLTLFLGGGSNVAQGLGRKSNLSGRTDIWAALIQASPNAIVGAGFESFWMSPNADQARHTLEVEGWWHPELLINEAHDGYLEIYLNLGVVGLGLISLILISGYMRAVAGFRRSPSVSGLMMAYIIIFAFYNITEAGFRTVGTSWVFLLLAIFSASGITSGRLVDDAFRPRNLKPGPITATTAPKKLMPQGKAICTTLTPIACGTCSDS
jgi:O-antigen ligase